MDAGPVLQENVSTIFIVRVDQLECSQMDELAGVEDDLRVAIANNHSGSSKFDQVSPTIVNEKSKSAVEQAVIFR